MTIFFGGGGSEIDDKCPRTYTSKTIALAKKKKYRYTYWSHLCLNSEYNVSKWYQPKQNTVTKLEKIRQDGLF